jgi:HlyD family secretion protein
MAKNGGNRWVRWLVVLVIVGVVAGGGLWFWKSHHTETAQYQTAPVTLGDLTQLVTATGQVEPVLNVQVGSQISGRINKIAVDWNSNVKSNQVIAEIDPSSYQANLLRAQADLTNAVANAALAAVQAKRADSLYTNNLISGSDHDIAQAQLQQAQAQVLSSKAAVENASVDLSRCTIYAPVDGVVISRNVDVGQTVAASFNTPTLFVIANDLTKMQIDALVSEADIGGVAVGQAVNFTVDAYPYRTFRGKVSQIRYGAQTNQNVVNYDCVVQVDNADLKLLPGMTANVSIIVAERQNVFKIPNAALRFRPPETVIAETKTNVAMRTPVSTGGGGRANGDGMGRGGPREGGGPGPGGGGRRGGEAGGGERPTGTGQLKPRPEKQLSRNVYVLPPDGNGVQKKPVPVQVKVGISDGTSTEVTEGVTEGQQVVIGVISTGENTSARPANPFGGGMRRF